MIGQIVRPRIVEAAIHLYGQQGREGVNIHEVARVAKTTAGTVWTLFCTGVGAKGKLYRTAVLETIHRAHEAVAKSVSVLPDESDPNEDVLLEAIGQSLKVWYCGLSQAETRLLLQVEMSDQKYRQLASAPFKELTNHLARALARIRISAAINRYELARTLVSTVFHLKLYEQDNSEKQEAGAIIDQLVLLLSAPG